MHRIKSQNSIIREEAFALDDVPQLTDFLPNLPTYPNPLQNSPAYAIVKQQFVDPKDVVSQKIITQKNSAKGVHFRRAGPQKKVYFKSDDVRTCIVTCSGLCPGINIVIREIVCGLNYMHGVDDVLWIEGGYKGFYSRNTITLTPKFVNDIHKRRVLKKAKDEVGIVLGKSQALLKKEDAERVLLHKLIELSINYLPNLYFVRQCFDDHHFNRKAIHYASEVFFTINISRSSIAELLTSMCDDILKKDHLTRIMSSKLMDREDEIFTDEERQAIDKVVMIVSLLSDIDDFIEFYSHELARRLLEKKNGDPREIYVLEMIT
ncbi:hypothetical protein GIB67_003864 [Kingdonia uniflora]|uniref:Cullin family profile domain-containing protein n=1 Tax=Kingdonia uniflora TaxID=39325 RepID=A0A7J7LK56_9MAGN|nr:hypothetical protein GIB67_003864 [Kingdonia uniflora]